VNKKLLATTSIFLLVLTTLSAFRISQASEPLFSYDYMGVHYEFYDDHFIAVRNGDYIIVKSSLLGSRLSRLFQFDFDVEWNELGLPIVTYTYSLEKQIFGKTVMVVVKHNIKFSITGFLKLSTEILSPLRLSKALSKLFTYQVLFSGEPNYVSHKAKLRHLMFDYGDVVRARLPYRKAIGLKSLELSFDGNDQNTLVIDPTIGSTEGEATPQRVSWKYVNKTRWNVTSYDKGYTIEGSGSLYSEGVSGSISDTLYDDDVWFAYIVKASGDSVKVSGWFQLSIQVNISKADIEEIAVRIKLWGNLVFAGYVKCYIYNFDSGSWTQLASAYDQAGEPSGVTAYNDVFTGTNAYVSDTGEIRVKGTAAMDNYANIGVEDCVTIKFDVCYANVTVIESDETTTTYAYYWAESDANATYRWDFGYNFPVKREEAADTGTSDCWVKLDKDGSALSGWTVKAYNKSNDALLETPTTNSTGYAVFTEISDLEVYFKIYSPYWTTEKATTNSYTANLHLNVTLTDVSDRELFTTFPKGHEILNITSVATGTTLYAENYTVAEYNSTHWKVTLPEATIAEYGEKYKLFTHATNAVYDLKIYYNGEEIIYASPNKVIDVSVCVKDPYGSGISQDVTFMLINASDTADVENRTDGTSDANGWFNFTLTLPSIKQTYIIQANTSGDYAGILNFTKPHVTDLILTLTVDDDRINVGDDALLSGTIKYSIDNSQASGYVLINGSAVATGTGSFSTLKCQEAMGKYLYVITGANDSKAVDTIVSSPSVEVIWDYIKLTSLTASEVRVPVGTEVKVWATAVLAYDSHGLGSGDNVTINGYDFTWDSENNRFELSISQSTPTTITFDTLTNSSSPGSYESTYGIGVGTANGLSVTVEWYSEEISGSTIISGEEPSEPTQITPQPPMVPPEGMPELARWGTMGIAAIILGAGAYSYVRGRDLGTRWERARSRRKEVKWKKRKPKSIKWKPKSIKGR